MKRIIVAICLLTFLLTSCSPEKEKVYDNFNTTENAKAESIESVKEMRGVWLSYFEISKMAKGKTQDEYYKNAESVIQNIKNGKLNTIFFQVRCFSDALYESSVFPTSSYIASKQGEILKYDPLKIFIEIAEKNNIDVHAWVNPFRVSYETDFNKLSQNNPAKIFYEKNKKNSALIVCDKGIYYNPASEDARSLILSGIRELVTNYKIKGIQFDDYFYPEAENFNDDELFNEYKKLNGEKSKRDWRKENLTNFISSVYSLIKGINPDVVFGVSPSAKKEHNEKVYADIEKWCSESGYLDYIMPQIYYGFENSLMDFSSVAEYWAEIERYKGISLYCGFAAYKSGIEDENAGKGENEWIDNSDILKREYKYIKNIGGYSGFSLYSYSYCYGENITKNGLTEIANLTTML